MYSLMVLSTKNSAICSWISLMGFARIAKKNYISLNIIHQFDIVNQTYCFCDHAELFKWSFTWISSFRLSKHTRSDIFVVLQYTHRQ
jgi:hypothetical protein